MLQVSAMAQGTQKSASSACTVVYEYLTCIIFTFIFLLIGAVFFLYKTIITRTVCALGLGGVHESFDFLSSLVYDDTIVPVVAVLKFKGTMTRERIIKIFQDKIFHPNNKSGQGGPNKSHCLQLQQYPVSFLGYWFWKFDSAFNLENHILEEELFREYGSEYSKMLESIHKHLLHTGFPPNRSPWDVTVFNYKKYSKGDDFTVVAIRLHHSLADAKSVVKFIAQGLGNKKCTASVSSVKRKDFSIAQMAMIPVYMFQHNMETLKCKKLTQGHPWIVPNVRNDDSHILVKMSQEISLNLMKSGKYCTSAYLIAGVTGAVKKYVGKFQSPYTADSLPIATGLPAPNHPDYLTNKWFVGAISTPVESHTESDRLKICHNNYKSLNGSSMTPVCMSVMMQIIESFPASLKSMFPKVGVFPAVISNIAGENEELWIDEFQCLDYSLCSTPANTPIGVLFFVFSYRGNIRVTVVGKSNVIDEEKCEALVKMIEHELMSLTS